MLLRTPTIPAATTARWPEHAAGASPARAFWPDAFAYQEAVQDGRCLAPELGQARVVTDRRGLPLTYSGRFAVVFRLAAADGVEYALRCFTRAASGHDAAANEALRQRRYAVIAPHLARLPDYFVPFRYLEQGVRVGSQWYPAVALGWAEGETLGRFVARRRRDPAALRRLAGTLDHLLGALEDAGIAHGDWQHDNLLVTESGRSVTLVDYDGLFVPELAGTPAPELGHSNYQHPQRAPGHFGPGLDRFAHGSLTVALRALAREPALWDHFGAGDDCLLFSRADFVAPEASPVFAAVHDLARRLGDHALAANLERLRAACCAGAAGVFVPAGLEATESSAGEAPWWQEKARRHAGQQHAAGPNETNEVTEAPPVLPDVKTLTPVRDFVGALTEPRTVATERINHAVVQGVSLAALLPTILLALAPGEASPVVVVGRWLAPLLLAAALGAGYLLWPAKALFDQIAQEIADRRDRITANRMRHARVARAVVDPEFAGLPAACLVDFDALIQTQLTRTKIHPALNVQGVSAATLHALAGGDAATGVGDAAVAGLPEAEVAALRRWLDGLRDEAARDAARQVRKYVRFQAEGARFDAEEAHWERQIAGLFVQARQFPPTSFLVYLRKICGLAG